MYISCDIETTGLDPDKHQIIQFGAVLDDLKSPINDLPKIEYYIHHEDYIFQSGALVMNKGIMEKIHKNTHPWCYSCDLVPHFLSWLNFCGIRDKITFAGKNFSNFDLRFLEKLPHWGSVPYRRRILDVGNLYWYGEDRIPNLESCCKLANIESKIHHTALADAIKVVRLIRHYRKILYATPQIKKEKRSRKENSG